MTFDSFGFDRRILAGIEALGYEKPTPIQERSIPHVLEGKDVLALAQTGTGKTAAFALPIMQRLLQNKERPNSRIRVLVLAPTRELAVQTQEFFREFTKKTGLRSTAIYGGVGFNPQIKALKYSSIVVACPGRLLDIMRRGNINLSGVQTLVLDEADRMLDMGFLPDIRAIISQISKTRQNLLFSATMPKEIRGLADNILQDPSVIQVANTAPAKTVKQALYPVPRHLKPAMLEALLRGEETDSVLVFTRTKHKAKSLAKKLGTKGWRAVALQGNMSQNARQKALNGFRKGQFQIMVATDVAARGIDCDKISHVINFDIPEKAECYTHRIGRTGRAGRSGTAITLVSRDEKFQLRTIERGLGSSLQRKELEGFDYDEKPAKGEETERPRYQSRNRKPGNSAPKRKFRGSRSGDNKSRETKSRDGGFRDGNDRPRKKKRRQSSPAAN